MRIIRTSKEAVTMIGLAELKRFGNIVGESRDNELEVALFRAISQVEDISNVSLSGNTVEIHTEDEVNFQRLYFYPIISIDSVVNADTDEVLTDYTFDGSVLRFTYPTKAIITYTTQETSIIEKQILRQCALELAIAYFDGIDKIAPILLKIPRAIC